jgi:hypothetical protein
MTKYKIEHLTVEGFKFPIILDTKTIQSMYKSNKQKPMLGVVYDYKKLFAAMFCNQLFLTLSKQDKEICVLHELGHICYGHNPQSKPNNINELLTNEHNADLFAVQFRSKTKVVKTLKKLLELDKDNSLLLMRQMLLDDVYDGPLPALKESSKAKKYHQAHKTNLTKCAQMFDAINLE